MISISHLTYESQDPDPQDYDIPFEDSRGTAVMLTRETPIETPLADLLAASPRVSSGASNAAGMDAEVMSFAEWSEAHVELAYA